MATAFDSLTNLCTDGSSAEMSSRRIFTATIRLMSRSTALKTTAIPPTPITFSILYLLSNTCPINFS